MPYIERDQTGKVKGVYHPMQSGYAEEFLPDDHADVIAFRAPKPALPDPMQARLATLESTIAILEAKVRQLELK